MFHDDDFLNTKKKIVFYGAGRYAREFARRHCVESHDIRIPDYVCDRDPKKWDTSFFGAPICSPERLFTEAVDDVIIVLTTAPVVVGDIRDRLYYDFWAAASLEMRFCLAKRPADELDALRARFADDKSRVVFDTMTRRQADGQFWFRDVYEPHPYFMNDVVPSLPDGEVLGRRGARVRAGTSPRSRARTRSSEPSTHSSRTLRTFRRSTSASLATSALRPWARACTRRTRDSHSWTTSPSARTSCRPPAASLRRSWTSCAWTMS